MAVNGGVGAAVDHRAAAPGDFDPVATPPRSCSRSSNWPVPSCSTRRHSTVSRKADVGPLPTARRRQPLIDPLRTLIAELRVSVERFGLATPVVEANPAKMRFFLGRCLVVTTLADRPPLNFLIDLRKEVAYRRHEVLGAVNMLIKRARSACVPVVWVRHADEELKAGSEAWQIVAELAPAREK